MTEQEIQQQINNLEEYYIQIQKVKKIQIQRQKQKKENQKIMKESYKLWKESYKQSNDDYKQWINNIDILEDKLCNELDELYEQKKEGENIKNKSNINDDGVDIVKSSDVYTDKVE